MMLPGKTGKSARVQAIRCLCHNDSSVRLISHSAIELLYALARILSNIYITAYQDAGYIDCMELRHLRHFVAVAETLHFGRAAEQLYMAQPPLSQSIRQLEAEVGVALFERTSRRVLLTPAGAVFQARALRILASVEEAALAARRAERGEEGWLGIGFSASAAYDVLPDVLRDFRTAYPDVELRLYEMNAAEQATALRDEKIHLGIARPSIEEPGLVRETITHELFVVALPSGHPRAVSADLDLAELAGEPFILFPTLPKPSYGDSILQVCALAGFVPHVAQEVREMQTAISLVSAGMGIALVPAPVQHMQRAGVTYLPLRSPPAFTELTAATRRNDLSPTLRNFLTLLRAR